jgi:hypothetical protein
MNRMRQALVATLVGVGSVGSLSVAAQDQPKAPALKSVLAGKKFTPPIKGMADVDFTQPVTKRVGKMVVTKITVKNASNAPIPRLTIGETWFDKSGNTIPGGKASINGLLQPGEVKVLELETPYDARMSSNSWSFSHANGEVKPHKVKSLDAPAAEKEAGKKQPAAKTAAAKKK